MRIPTTSAAMALAMFLGACAGLTVEEQSASTTSALEGDGTIPRVPQTIPSSDLNNLPGDLSTVAVPGPSNIGDFVQNQEAAIVLGKALFWDMQVGSDGVQACASCHFRAGADPRSKNQLSPGLKHFPAPDHTFKKGGPNYQLVASDFPLTRLATPGVRGALDLATDNNDVVSSQGIAWLGEGADPDGFQVDGKKTRRVEPRNTPTVINAVFNHRQFWDGRAENIFNGVNHVGARDPNARVLRSDDRSAAPVPVQIALANSSLASQAVAPIVSDLEMAAPGRDPRDVAKDLHLSSQRRGRKVRPLRPLGNQKVSPTDSVLGALSRAPRAGLTVDSYDDLVKAAFKPEWWDSSKKVRLHDDGRIEFLPASSNDHTGCRERSDSDADHGNRSRKLDECTYEDFTLMEYNFALFFGLAIQAYEATLVSDDAPWDRFRRQHPTATDPALNPWTNPNPDHISRLALFGSALFNDRTRGPTNIRCSNCHELAEFTDASVRRINIAVNGPVRNRDGNVIDKGFNNIGVRPTDDDLGAGGSDAFGPLSHSKRLFPGALPATFDGAAVNKGFGIEGAFKVPGLRNVALTAPYFHNGDARTLRDAVAFYSRGGNVFPVQQKTDGAPIEPLGVPNLTNDEIDALVAFLESLTDERVLYRRAPFDHPQLFVPNGHRGDEDNVKSKHGFAADSMYEVNAVGAAGGEPVPAFLEGPFR